MQSKVGGFKWKAKRQTQKKTPYHYFPPSDILLHVSQSIFIAQKIMAQASPASKPEPGRNM